MSTSTAQLRATALTRAYGDRLVVDLPDLVVGPAERIGVVGENGSGKSTLLRLLASVEPADTGMVSVHGSVGYLPQLVELPPAASVHDMLDDALRELHNLEGQLHALEEQMAHDAAPEVLAEYAARLAEFEASDGWTAPARVDATVAGLGLGGLDRARALGTLSGGQRSRLALACLLVRRPEVLVLDEPTNHLDDEALGYLESTLTGWTGVVVAASHDRAFLDSVCTSIVDLDPARHGATRYGGSYTAYLDARAAERARWQVVTPPISTPAPLSARAGNAPTRTGGTRPTGYNSSPPVQPTASHPTGVRETTTRTSPSSKASGWKRRSAGEPATPSSASNGCVPSACPNRRGRYGSPRARPPPSATASSSRCATPSFPDD